MADAFMLQTISFGLNERLCEICDSIGFPISRANYRRFGNLTDKKNAGEIAGIRKASWLSDSDIDTDDEAEEMEAGWPNCRGCWGNIQWALGEMGNFMDSWYGFFIHIQYLYIYIY